MDTTADPGYKTVSPDELWPEHAGHEILYSEHGRTDYRVTKLTVVISDPYSYVATCEYDSRATDGDVTESEYWCRTCGVQLREDWDDDEGADRPAAVRRS